MNEIIIREMKPEEKKEVTAVAFKAFPFLMRLFFSFSKDTLIAEYKGSIVGGVILKMFSIRKSHKSVKAGLISFIFSDPAIQGVGVGQRLAEAGISYMEDEGCTELFASVEGFNTSSSKLFSYRDFSLLSVVQQFRTYGLQTFSLWIHTFHLFDVGHFLWSKSSMKSERDGSFQWFYTILIQTATALVMHLRRGSNYFIDPSIILRYFLIFLFFIGGRTAIQFLTAKALKLDTEYRMWETGLLLNFGISSLFGGMLSAPGSLYPKKPNWKYSELQKQLGTMALTSSLFMISALCCIKLLLMQNHSSSLNSLLKTAFPVGVAIVIVDTLLPFFPFTSYNGRRLWDWNKLIWGVAALLTVLLLIL